MIDLSTIREVNVRPLQNTPFCLRQRTLADQAQILILEILYVFLWLKFSPSLNLNKNEHFSKVSMFELMSEAQLSRSPEFKFKSAKPDSLHN